MLVRGEMSASDVNHVDTNPLTGASEIDEPPSQLFFFLFFFFFFFFCHCVVYLQAIQTSLALSLLYSDHRRVQDDVSVGDSGLNAFPGA